MQTHTTATPTRSCTPSVVYAAAPRTTVTAPSTVSTWGMTRVIAPNGALAVTFAAAKNRKDAPGANAFRDPV